MGNLHEDNLLANRKISSNGEKYCWFCGMLNSSLFGIYFTKMCGPFYSRNSTTQLIGMPNCWSILSKDKNKESSSILDQFYSELLMDVIVSSSANLDVSNFEMKSQVFIVVAICSKYILVSCQAGKRTSKEVVESRTTQRAILNQR